MRVRFWGTRGSIPKSGPHVLRHGGNTACVEVRTDAGTLIVIDCGTGAHDLGLELVASGAAGRSGHLLISHTHWDHIQGLPFFAPLFSPGSRWDVYGPRGVRQSLQETLAGQMRSAYFPVALEGLGADIRVHELVEGTLWIGDVRVATRYLNHPALTLGYRLQADRATLVYASDHGPHARELASGHGRVDGEDLRHAGFLRGADFVIHDAQFTPAEYGDRAGWGHSTGEYAARMCQLAGARTLALTHHDPRRSDGGVDRMVRAVRAVRAPRLRCTSSPPPKAKCSSSPEAAIQRHPDRKPRARTKRRRLSCMGSWWWARPMRPSRVCCRRQWVRTASASSSAGASGRRWKLSKPPGHPWCCSSTPRAGSMASRPVGRYGACRPGARTTCRWSSSRPDGAEPKTPGPA
jgi:ribonuclease BN (tRNA processing enzyme)